MAIIVVSQRFLLAIVIDLSGIQASESYAEQHQSAIMIDSLFQSFEFLLIMVGLSL